MSNLLETGLLEKIIGNMADQQHGRKTDRYGKKYSWIAERLIRTLKEEEVNIIL